jgi:outer membrane protein assembly factor BamB
MATGEVRWQHRLPGEVWASPVANNGHVTFFCKHGSVVTLKGGSELVEVAESHVSTTDVVYGVAAVDSAWIVRTGRGLVCIRNQAAPATVVSDSLSAKP